MRGSRGRSRPARAAVVGVAAVLLVTAGAPAGAGGRLTGTGGGGPRAGALDTRFGAGGVVRTDHEGTPDGAEDVLVQPDGRVVAAGWWGRSAGEVWYTDFALARYDRSGRLDATFGDAGTVATDFFGGYDQANAVLRQRDGRLVAVGAAFRHGGSDPSFALARYRPDGRLDPSFGDGGLVSTDVGDHDEATAAALQPDGRIVVAGYDLAADRPRAELVVARYRPDGTLDPTFGVAGMAITAVSPSDPSFLQGQDVVIQPDGHIVTVSRAHTVDGSDVVVTRFRPDGSLDPRFGDGGFVTLSFSAESFEDAAALRLLPDGRIAVLTRFESTWGLARLRSDGRLDTGFGTGGMVRSNVEGDAHDLVVQDDGRLVVAGTTILGESYDVMLVRYRRDGRLDRSFGAGGIVTTDIDRRVDGAGAVTSGPDDTLVIAGSTRSAANQLDHDLLVARYHG